MSQKQRSSARLEAQRTTTPGWIKPLGSKIERRYMQDLLEHLHDWKDTNTQLLRFLCSREYRITMSNTMNTFQTLKAMRNRLRELNAPFIRFNEEQQCWEYWTDYTESGLSAWQSSQEKDMLEDINVDDDRTNDKDKEDAEHSQPLLTQTDLAPKTPPAKSDGDWFSSPPLIQDPRTGAMVHAPTPPRLQAMIDELQNHSDWYDDADGQTTAQTKPPDQFITITEKHRHSSPNRHVETTSTPQRSVPHNPYRKKEVSKEISNPYNNRYKLLMDNAVETLSEHARMLETAASERHRTRMENVRTTIQDTATEQLANMKTTMEQYDKEQRSKLEQYCEEQVESLMVDLDNFSGQVRQLKQEIMDEVREEIQAARVIPIHDGDDEDNDPSTATHHKIENDRDQEPTSAQRPRWSNVDYAAIRTGTNAAHVTDIDTTKRTTPLDDKYANPEYQLPRLRSATTPITLRTRDRKAVIKFYNGFVDFLHQYRVPIKHFDQIQLDTLNEPSMHLYPDSLRDETLRQRYSAAIYARLEEDDVLDDVEPMYTGLKQLYNRTRDGYSLLKSLLAGTLLIEAKNLTLLSTPPLVDANTHPYAYASQLQEFFLYQTKFQRPYTTREQATMYLQGMTKVHKYMAAATQLMHDLEKQSTTGELAHHFLFPTLPMTLATHAAAPPMTENGDAYASLNVTRAHNATASRSPHEQTTQQIDNRRPQRTAQRNRNSPRRPSKDVQCPACATYGHELTDCFTLPKVAACLDYIQRNEAMAQSTLQRFRQSQHPANRQNTKAVLSQALLTHLDPNNDALELDELVEEITDTLFGQDLDDGPIGRSIFQMQATPFVIHKPTTCDTDYVPDSVHPVKFPLLEQVCDVSKASESEVGSTQYDYLNDASGATDEDECITIAVTTVQQRDLADTGASVSATGLRNILHDFTTNTKYEITGYDGKITKAAGEGYAHVRNPESTAIERILFIYAPSISGTIFSLEHHARTHPRIHRWTQEATPSANGGWIKFYDKGDTLVSKYPTLRSKGVYYIQDMKFIPATRTILESTIAPPRKNDDETHPMMHMTCQPILGDDTNDFAIEDGTDGIRARTHVPTGNTYPDIVAHISAQALTTTGIDNQILNYEIWHQRLGHCSETKMRRTQALVDGIPKFQQSAIPPLIRCRACDVASLRKAPRGPTITDDTTLQPGQVFQMDIGFFRGPGNLADVYDRKADPTPKIIESRQGFVCYLLIIDRSTRYIWLFPLKSQAVPPDLINIFLTAHGNKDRIVKRIRTDGDGTLAESTEFRRIIAAYGYIPEKSATDASSQNGMAERPHQTLGEKTRCMLYSAGLPIYFWADAMVYAVYVYNRLFHDGTKQIPYTAWTGRRADVSHLRAFGAKVIVKRRGSRPTKGDPHYYDGRFLRFGATQRNLIYFDEVTQREKIARHCTMDEFHYDSPQRRPPGAQQVLERVTPTLLKKTTKPQDVCYLLEDSANPLMIPAIDKIEPLLADGRIIDTQPTTATAASMFFRDLDRTQQQAEEIVNTWVDTNRFMTPVCVRIAINRLPTLGFQLKDDSDTPKVFLTGCQEGTEANRIPRWRSRIRYGVLRSANDRPIHSVHQFKAYVAELRQAKCKYMDITFAKIDSRAQPITDAPQMHYDQLRHINHIHSRLLRQMAHVNLTRSQLKKRIDYQLWRQAEWQQHDKYQLQEMFGNPIPRPAGATVLPFVWTYIIKDDPLTGKPKFKARGTCNGGPRYGKAVTLAETYATCVEQPACRLYWAITAANGLISVGADAGNAFAEAPPPVQPFYMVIDDQFREWWTEHCQRPPIPPGYVLPVQHALQGHPESGRLWEKHIHGILVKHLQFRPTTHEKCLYSRRNTTTGNLELLLRQVDDFAVSAETHDTCKAIIAQIGTHLKVPLNDLGVIRKFNGVNVHQSKWYIKISCEDYLLKILESHAWLDLKAANQPTPMRSDSAYHRQLELAERPKTEDAQQQIQNDAGFSYRTAIGELIYALVIARPDLSMATTKLSQYSMNPAFVHYQAVKAIFAFLNNTREDGLIFWRIHPRIDLPDTALPTPHSNRHNALTPVQTNPQTPLAYSDSDWGSDFAHRRSISGFLILLAGAAIIYKTIYQKTVALSSTEAEFMAAAETGKYILYIRSLLQDLGLLPPQPTTMYVDNTGAIFMIEAHGPTKRTRHVDIRYFALLDWQDKGLLTAKNIPTDQNLSDSFTKATGRTKFHQHADIYMGRIPPTYVTSTYPDTVQPAFIHAMTDTASSPLQYTTSSHVPLWFSSVLESMGG